MIFFENTNKLVLLTMIVACQVNACTKAQTKQFEQMQLTNSLSVKIEQSISKEVEQLMSAYPALITGFEDNYIVFADSSKMLFDDRKEKSSEELLKNPDVQDMFTYSYPIGEIGVPEKFHNPGRIRNDEFFKTIYGKTATEVQKNLIEIVWCPKLVGQKLRISKINDVDKHLMAISTELDEHPEWKDYLHSTGTFNWRKVRSAKDRLSSHSFGIAIDLNTKYSNYWQWDCKCITENIDLTYKNKIPQGIIDIFEKHGFIWGGKWYHYDTMHFEYRPELLLSKTDKLRKNACLSILL